MVTRKFGYDGKGLPQIILFACIAAILIGCGGGGSGGDGNSGGGSTGGTYPVPGAAPPPSYSGPAILFTDVNSGPVTGGPNGHGIPISLFGKGFGAERGSSTVTIGGVPVSDYLVWGENNAHNGALDMIVVQPGPGVAGGAIIVTVNGKTSNVEHSFAARTGNIYYLSPNGSDSNDCSAGTPCQTILHVAAEVMQAGDTVLIREGTYNEGEIWIRADHGQSGSLGRPKVIKNYPVEEVYYPNADRPFLLDADYITVSGLNFQNGKSLEIAAWASSRQKGNWLVNNTFHGNIAWDAIHVEGDDHVVAGNVCNATASAQGTQGHCYYVSQSNNVSLLYNVGSGAPGYEIHIYDQRRSIPDFRRVISNILVEGNLLKSSPERSGMLIGIDDEGGYGNMIDGILIRNNIFTANNFVGIQLAGSAPNRNIKIYNNTFYQNGRQGINIPDLASVVNIDIRNNLIYQSENSNCVNNCSWYPQAHVMKGAQAQNVTVDCNSYHPGSPNLIGTTDANAVTGAVYFFNDPALDFHLLPGSSVIDRGTILADIPRDYDGTPRPQGAAPDIGAFELSSN